MVLQQVVIRVLKCRLYVVPSSGNELVIEPKDMAGSDGASLEFDFGEVVQGESKVIVGSYEIYRPNGSNLLVNGVDSNIGVGFLDSNGTIINGQKPPVVIGGNRVETAVTLVFANAVGDYYCY